MAVTAVVMTVTPVIVTVTAGRRDRDSVTRTMIPVMVTMTVFTAVETKSH